MIAFNANIEKPPLSPKLQEPVGSEVKRFQVVKHTSRVIDRIAASEFRAAPVGNVQANPPPPSFAFPAGFLFQLDCKLITGNIDDSYRSSHKTIANAFDL